MIIVVLSLGLYGWLPAAVAVVAGTILAWSVGYAISRPIKHDDPDWVPHGGAERFRRNSRVGFPEA